MTTLTPTALRNSLKSAAAAVIYVICLMNKGLRAFLFRHSRLWCSNLAIALPYLQSETLT